MFSLKGRENGMLLFLPGTATIRAWLQSSERRLSAYMRVSPARRARVDRCLVRMVDWAPSEVELVGMQPLGPQWQKTLKRGVVRMETLPSDHYGIYSSFQPVA